MLLFTVASTDCFVHLQVVFKVSHRISCPSKIAIRPWAPYTIVRGVHLRSVVPTTRLASCPTLHSICYPFFLLCLHLLVHSLFEFVGPFLRNSIKLLREIIHNILRHSQMIQGLIHDVSQVRMYRRLARPGSTAPKFPTFRSSRRNHRVF